jgi:hypothetical protein
MGKEIKVNNGDKYGSLTIIKEIDPVIYSNKKFRRFLCKCECGNIKPFLLNHLRTGNSKSCGCLSGRITHNLSTSSRFYETWRSMKQRCYYKKHRNYKYYGARGIKVCKEWLSFKNFHEWAEKNCSHEGLTLDRIDVNDNYCPKNCKWSTRIEQSRNTRRNVFISYNGVSKCISEWAKELNINPTTLWYRIVKYKWSIEKALNTPLRNL